MQIIVAIVIFWKLTQYQQTQTLKQSAILVVFSLFSSTLTQVLDTKLHKYQYVHQNEATVYKGKRQNHDNQHGNYIQGKEAKQ